MRHRTLAFAAVSAVGLTSLGACAQPMRAAPQAGPLFVEGAFAEARLLASGGREIGRAEFVPSPHGVLIRLTATGLAPGWHGAHLHAVGRCDDPKFQSAGAHVKHHSAAQHGLLNAQGPESGDLPNVFVAANGTATVEMFTALARLRAESGGASLLDADGSAILIHAGPDDHRTQPIGGSGDRIACGVIRPLP